MTRYDDLVRITAVMKEEALEKHRRNIEETRRLTTELSQIDTLRQAAQADMANIGARQILGADALWQGWLVRKRADLLRQMALARALEQESLSKARTAFSRAEATEKLQKDEVDKSKRRRLKAAADVLDDLAVLRRGLQEDEADT